LNNNPVLANDIENPLASETSDNEIMPTGLKASIPILLVGNKLDMVSEQTQQEIRDASPQQLLMVC